MLYILAVYTDKVIWCLAITVSSHALKPKSICVAVVIEFRSTGQSDIPMDNGPPTVKSFLPFQPYKGPIAGAAAAMVCGSPILTTNTF